MNRIRGVLVVAGVAAVIGCATPAYAEPDAGDAGADAAAADSAFLTSLRAAGLTFAGGDQAIVVGHAVCSMANNGETGLQVVKQLTADNPGLTMDGASQFAALAANAYCPHHLHK